MEELFSILEYIIMGGMLSFLLFTSGHYLFIVPQVASHRSSSTRALHQMLCVQLLYNCVLYLLWLLPVFFIRHSMDLYSEEQTGWDTYYTMMDYLDMILLPVGMLLGHTVTRGTLPPLRMFVMSVAPFLVAMGLHFAFGWQWLVTVMGIFSIAYCLFQFLWYGRCVRIHQMFLLNSYSNIDNCEMKWYLKAQLPMLVLGMCYYPLVIMPQASWPSLIYDVLTILCLAYLVAMITLHQMDDKAYELIRNVDFRQKTSEIIQTAISEAQAEAPAPAAEPTPAPEASAPVEPTPAPESPKEWTRVEKESYDFTEQIKKLEEEEFYLDPDVNIDYLANHLGTNRHYVSNYLNQILKMPFYVYVNKLRLEHAERLLRTSNDKASSIGYLCGFNSEGTFRRLFKEQYGCTPTQYVKQPHVA